MDDSKMTVILEDLRSQFKVFGEGLGLVNDKVDGLAQRLDRVDQRLDRVDQRLDRVEYRLDRVDLRLDRVDQRLDRVEQKLEINQMEHKQMIQMIKELDSQFQVELKRVK